MPKCLSVYSMSGISDKTVNASVCASDVLMCQQCYGFFLNLLQEQMRLVVVGKIQCSFFSLVDL